MSSDFDLKHFIATRWIDDEDEGFPWVAHIRCDGSPRRLLQSLIARGVKEGDLKSITFFEVLGDGIRAKDLILGVQLKRDGSGDVEYVSLKEYNAEDMPAAKPLLVWKLGHTMEFLKSILGLRSVVHWLCPAHSIPHDVDWIGINSFEHEYAVPCGGAMDSPELKLHEEGWDILEKFRNGEISIYELRKHFKRISEETLKIYPKASPLDF